LESLILDMEDKVKAIRATNEKLVVANEKLKEKIATHKVPSIDEYINLKIQLENEQKKTKMFERKINIKKLIERNQTIKKIRPPPQVMVRRRKASPLKGVMVEVMLPIGVETSSFSSSSSLTSSASSTSSPSSSSSSLMLLKDVSAFIYLPKMATQECSVRTSLAEEVVEGYSVNLNCSHPGSICAIIACGPFPLWSQEESATIDVTANFVLDSIRDLTIFSVASSARTWVPGLEDLLEPHDALPDQAWFSTVLNSRDVTTGGVPLWQIIATVAGSLVLLLLLLLFLIWRTNFFKRNASDRQKEELVRAEMEEGAAAAEMEEETTLIEERRQGGGLESL